MLRKLSAVSFQQSASVVWLMADHFPVWLTADR